ncbi:MAG: DUF362 domain-containing protein [Opitutales bacterium]
MSPDFDCQAVSLPVTGRAYLSALLGLFLFLNVGAGLDAADLPPRGPAGLVWEATLAPDLDYGSEVSALLGAYEARVGVPLRPGERGKVGLKVNTRSGRGLSTPLALLRAVIDSLERRGYARKDILIVDASGHGLREAGIMPRLSTGRARFEGCPVLALDSGRYYDREWFYDSPLPSARQEESELSLGAEVPGSLEEGSRERKSFLPVPLLFEVDFWINLPVGVDDPSLGIDAALANATLWNVSNSRRFLANQATASAAVAEIAAIPELAERMVLHLVSLEKYQFIGGPYFNSIYTRSEPRLWLSSDPVALDRLIYDRINAKRRLEGFSEIEPLPRQLEFAASLDLGRFERAGIEVEPVLVEREEVFNPAAPRPTPRFEEPPDWLRRIVPW